MIQGTAFMATGNAQDKDVDDEVFTTWCVGGTSEGGAWCDMGVTFCNEQPVADLGATSCELVLNGYEEGDSVGISLLADDEQATGFADVHVLVSYGDNPVVTLLSPTEGNSFRSDELVSFEGTVTDADNPSSDLQASWLLGYGEAVEAEIAGVNNVVSGSGNIVGTGYIVEEGDQQVCLVVTDPAGNENFACAMVTITPPNSAPTCEILSPSDGASGGPTDVIEFQARVADPDESPVNLSVTWWSSAVATAIGASRPDDEGNVIFPHQLAVLGTQQITCEVTDTPGAIGSDSITYSAGQGPTVEISKPTNLGTYGIGEEVLFEGSFYDTINGCFPAYVQWIDESTSSGDTADTGLAGGTLLHDGWDPCFSSFTASDLTPGDHNISLTVTNTAGFWNSDRVFISIADCSSTWYRDVDGDGFGDDLDPKTACSEPMGYVAFGGDCDDSAADVNPGASESCNGLDDNCNGSTDEGFSPTTWYADFDGDTYGDPTTSVVSCIDVGGYVTNGTDCDDTNPAVNPAASEACDLGDNDCDGTTDEGFPFPPDTVWYRDHDGDGYGVPGASTTACEPPDGYVNNDDDCDDDDSSVSPGMTEQCNDKDDDCDATVDESDFTGAPTWFYDADLDGYGVTSTGITTCDPPTGYVAGYGDCDDADSDIFPTAAEDCDGLDNDCDGTVDDGYSYPATTEWYRDADSDGYGIAGAPLTGCEPPPGFVNNATDCDDADAAVNPGQAESCDTSKDDDCDGTVNESDAVDAITWYRDADTDGYGETSTALVQCAAPGGYVELWGDCDDALAEVNPGAAEVCDAADNDCDGSVDEGFTYPYGTTLYRDLDGDGYGTTSALKTGCEAGDGWSAWDGDCNDAETSIFPGNPEVCDTLDNDCSGIVDDGAVDAPTWYTDADADGYGVTASAVVSCTAPAATVTAWGDCDDTRIDINPGVTETCDGVDQDCDGAVDDGFPFPYGTVWYLDADGDGYGTVGAPSYSCDALPGYTVNPDDCDDTDTDVNPGQTDVCDTVDNNCDGYVDELNDFTPIWYYDEDGDGYGLTDIFLVDCTATAEYTSEPNDCDDENADINPGMAEACDGIDNDCGDDIDEDFDYEYGTTWYLDTDGDGYGTAGSPWLDCEYHPGYAVNADDCDDTSAAVNPGKAEVCATAYDDDCDGVANDATSLDATTWYEDADYDGWGVTATGTVFCTTPPCADCVYVTTPGDCDDAFSGVNPDAIEYCDGLDNDCDTFLDEDDAVDAATWYRDSDGDGYGDNAATQTACTAPTGYVSLDGDCNDFTDAAHPGGTEVCDSTNTDEDCDGLADDADAGATGMVTWYADTDADGFGNPAARKSACDEPDGYTNNDDDCDDGAYYINPAQVEVCDDDNVDEDCDTGRTADDDDLGGASGKTTWYQDADGDGYGATSSSKSACDQPTGYDPEYGDCDDTTSAIKPGATDTTGDGTDTDCDGFEKCYVDADNDGYRSTDTTLLVTTTDTDCSGSGLALVGDAATDCDDSRSTVNPSKVEVCDAYDLDEDCSGTADAEGSSGCSTYYYDGDGDGYGISTNKCLCSSSGKYTSTRSTDCDDSESAANPGETEVCDEIDNDCDSKVDEGKTSTWYYDYDGDGYGSTVSVVSCDSTGYYTATTSGDCDNSDPTLHPGAIYTYKPTGISYGLSTHVAGDEETDGCIDTTCTVTFTLTSTGFTRSVECVWDEPAVTSSGRHCDNTSRAEYSSISTLAVAPSGCTFSSLGDASDSFTSASLTQEIYKGASDDCGDLDPLLQFDSDGANLIESAAIAIDTDGDDFDCDDAPPPSGGDWCSLVHSMEFNPVQLVIDAL